MSHHRPGDVARAFVVTVREDLGLKGSDVSTKTENALIDAVERDLRERADQAAVDEARLVAVETESRAVATAVVAITEATQTATPAIVALKDVIAMKRPGG
jgi:adenylyl- and sulfurtransferase ThiI